MRDFRCFHRCGVTKLASTEANLTRNVHPLLGQLPPSINLVMWRLAVKLLIEHNMFKFCRIINLIYCSVMFFSNSSKLEYFHIITTKHYSSPNTFLLYNTYLC